MQEENLPEIAVWNDLGVGASPLVLSIILQFLVVVSNLSTCVIGASAKSLLMYSRLSVCAYTPPK